MRKHTKYIIPFVLLWGLAIQRIHGQSRPKGDMGLKNAFFTESVNNGYEVTDWTEGFFGNELDTVRCQQRSGIETNPNEHIYVAKQTRVVNDELNMIRHPRAFSGDVWISQALARPLVSGDAYGIPIRCSIDLPERILVPSNSNPDSDCIPFIDDQSEVQIWLGNGENERVQLVWTELDPLPMGVRFVEFTPTEAYTHITIVVLSGELKIDYIGTSSLFCIGDPSFEAAGGESDLPADLWNATSASFRKDFLGIGPSPLTQDPNKVFALMRAAAYNTCLCDPCPPGQPDCNNGNGGTDPGLCETEYDNYSGRLIHRFGTPLAENRDYMLSYDWLLKNPHSEDPARKAAYAESSVFSIILVNSTTNLRQEVDRLELSNASVGEAWKFRPVFFRTDGSFDRIELIYVLGDGEDAEPLDCSPSNGPRLQESSVFSDFFIDNITVSSPDASFDASIPCYPLPVDFDASSSTAIMGEIVYYDWDFDNDGVYEVRTQGPEASHVFPDYGTYKVGLRVTSTCSTRDIYYRNITIGNFSEGVDAVQATVIAYPDILGVGAATFVDSRPMDLRNRRKRGDLGRLSTFGNGQMGIWRADASYAYVADRKSSGDRSGDGELSLGTDGTFSYSGFSWKDAPNFLPEGWKRTADITKYDAYGTELENKDILGFYSAALYDEKGERETAVGANAKYDELGFTGFELYEGTDESPQLGNFTFFGKSEIQERVIAYAGKDDVAIIEWPYDNLDFLEKRKFTLSGRSFTEEQDAFVIQEVEIGECHNRHPDADKQDSVSIVKLTGFGLSGLGAWAGELSYYRSRGPASRLSEWLSITEDKAHTGSRSLKVSYPSGSDAPRLQQGLLVLQPGKKYVISAWVSIPDSAGNLSLDTLLADGLGIALRVTGTGARQFNPVFRPSGPIIEGWQRIEGIFTMPEREGRLQLSFLAGEEGIAYFDDLRVFPEKGNMQSYVYDPFTYRLRGTLDSNNFATLYFYDREGNLRIVKKETARGIKTIQEVTSNQPDTKKD